MEGLFTHEVVVSLPHLELLGVVVVRQRLVRGIVLKKKMLGMKTKTRRHVIEWISGSI